MSIVEMLSTYGKDFDNRLLPEDRAANVDWPINFENFQHWYSYSEQVIGIAGAPGSKLRPLKYNKAGKILDKYLKSYSSGPQIKPTPMAINSGNHGGRSPCHHSGLCQDYSCRFEAKSDMRVTTIREALSTGNLTIKSNTLVTKINKKGDYAESIECLSLGREPQFVEYKTPILVIGCETIETNRLMLISGLGNPAVVGRYLMFHVTGGARSLASEPTTSWDTAPHTAFLDHYYFDSQETTEPFIKTGILLVSSIGGPLSEIYGRKGGQYLWGDSAIEYLEKVYPIKLDLSYIGDGLPTQYNRVELSGVKDAFGMMGTSIFYKPHPFDINAGRYISKKAKEILSSTGALTEDSTPFERPLRRVFQRE